MVKQIHLVRHAQGLHNLSVENESLRDPNLTLLGKQQCANLRASFARHANLTKLVASPLRRTINTCDLAFGGPDHLYPIVMLDTLQEVSDAPCDTGSSKGQLVAEFDGKLDTSRVRDGWTDKDEGSIFEPKIEALMARSKEARRALKQIFDETEGDVAVVLHGGILHFITDDWEGVPLGRATAWTNCMCRSYTFAESREDNDVRLVETEESWRRREHVAGQPLSVTEQRELRLVVQRRIASCLKIRM